MATGWNKQSSGDPTLHGEIVAIRNYSSQYGNLGWEDTTLYTTGEPCPMCMGAIIWAGIPPGWSMLATYVYHKLYSL